MSLKQRVCVSLGGSTHPRLILGWILEVEVVCGGEWLVVPTESSVQAELSGLRCVSNRNVSSLAVYRGENCTVGEHMGAHGLPLLV